MRLTILFLFISTLLQAQIKPYNYGTYNFGSYNYGDKTVSYDEKSLPPGGTKEAVYSGFMISGTDTLWKDISGHGRHATLRYAKNFVNTAEWTAGVLPYASEVLVIFPASLLSFDLDSFMFAGGGVARSIPTISFYQDIDYGHKLYCKEIAQQLNSDSTEVHGSGVRYFTVYSSVQTGGNLTACNSWFGVPTESATAYWVSKTGNDATGNGTKANPYLTIEKAYKTVAAGFTIYVKSGIYTEEYNGTTIRYFYADKAGAAMTIKGLGFNEIRSIATTYVIRIVDGTLNFEGFIINGETTTDRLVDSYVNNNVGNFSKCYFKGAITYNINTTINAAINTYSLDKCVFIGGKYITVRDGVSVINSYVDAVTNYVTDFNYNKIVNATYTVAALVNTLASSNTINIKFNKVNIKTDFVGVTTPSITQSVNVKHNIIDYVWTSSLGRSITIISGSSANIVPTISNNTIISESTGLTDILYAIQLNCTTPTISDNIINFSTQSQSYGIFIGTVVTAGKCIIDNNTIKLNTTSGMLLTLGSETSSTGIFDNSEVTNNHFIGHLLDYPSTVGTTHGILLNAGINMKFSYNKVEYCWLGLVMKTGTGQTYTSGGVYGNLFINNGRDIWLRKIKGLLIANNTLYGTSAYDKYSGGRIFIDSFDGYSSEHDSLVNNIIYQESNYYRIGMDAAAAANCKVYNTSLSPVTNMFLIQPSTYKTFAEATSEGYFIDCSNVNPNFKSSTELWPIPAITGEILSSPYNTILSTSTNWGSATQVPSIVTFTNSTGQKGAYGQ